MIFTLQLALFAVGWTFSLRALAPRHWLLIRPLGCSLCLSVWPSFILGCSDALSRCSSFDEFLLTSPTTALVVGGATGLGYLLNKIVDFISFQID